MTLEKFFLRVRRGRIWSVDPFGRVRCQDGRCPLGAFDDDLAPVPSFRGAAKMLGLSVPMARKIAWAADNGSSKDRLWLLKNLGIKL
jgi:hypothetical protein